MATIGPVPATGSGVGTAVGVGSGVGVVAARPEQPGRTAMVRRRATTDSARMEIQGSIARTAASMRSAMT